MYRSRVPKINSHPRSRVQMLRIVQSDVARSGFVLRLPGEHIVIAALAVVKECADRGQEVEGWTQLCVRLGRHGIRSGPAAVSIQGGERRHPAGNVVIAQTAGRLFDIWFKVKNRVAVLGVPRARDLRQLLDNVAALANKKLW